MTTETQSLIDHSMAVVTGPQREENHRVLQPVLTDLISFGLDLKQLHWNVVGPHFRSIHLQLDEIYADVLKAIDETAERLTACGHSPSGTASNVAKNAELQEMPAGFLRDEEVLRLAAQRTHEICGLIRTRMDEIEEKDAVTADLLHQVVGALEKHHWMVRANLA